MPTVKSIDEAAIIARLKKSGDKETVNYINQLKEAIRRQQDLTALAIKKLRDNYVID